MEDAIDKNPGNLGAALRYYSDTRNPDAEAMCDLAMYNYIEVGTRYENDSVLRDSFTRKNCCSFGFCPNCLSSTCTTFFPTSNFKIYYLLGGGPFDLRGGPFVG